MNPNYILSKNALKLYHYFLQKKQPDQWTNEQVFTSLKSLKLTKEQVLQILKELLEKDLISYRLSSKGNPCYRLNPNTSGAQARELTLFYHIQSHNPLPKNYQQIAKALGWSTGEVKSRVDQLTKEGLIQTINAKTIGPALVIKNPVSSTEETSEKQGPVLYLVDTENASNEQFYQGLEDLTAKDTVILIMSQNSKGFLTPQLAHRLFHSPAKVDTVLSQSSGKNSLDFVLVSEASLRLAKHPTQQVCIISKDQGYDAFIQHITQSLQLKTSQVVRFEKFLKNK